MSKLNLENCNLLKELISLFRNGNIPPSALLLRPKSFSKNALNLLLSVDLELDVSRLMTLTKLSCSITKEKG